VHLSGHCPVVRAINNREVEGTEVSAPFASRHNPSDTVSHVAYIKTLAISQGLSASVGSIAHAVTVSRVLSNWSDRRLKATSVLTVNFLSIVSRSYKKPFVCWLVL